MRAVYIRAVPDDLFDRADAGIQFAATLASRQDRMRELYLLLPETCRQRTVVVRETTSEMAERRRAAYGYDPEQDRCEIRLRRGVWRFPADWAHELGHLADQWAVSAGEREAWCGDWEDLRRLMPTRYARLSPGEGFAECFVEVLLGRVPAGYEPLASFLRVRIRRMVYGPGG
jgi:hypothetical protein